MTLSLINSVNEWVDFLFQRLQSTEELSQTHVTFLAIDQMDEEISLDQQEEKDIGGNLVIYWLSDLVTHLKIANQGGNM